MAGRSAHRHSTIFQGLSLLFSWCVGSNVNITFLDGNHRTIDFVEHVQHLHHLRIETQSSFSQRSKLLTSLIHQWLMISVHVTCKATHRVGIWAKLIASDDIGVNEHGDWACGVLLPITVPAPREHEVIHLCENPGGVLSKVGLRNAKQKDAKKQLVWVWHVYGGTERWYTTTVIGERESSEGKCAYEECEGERRHWVARWDDGVRAN